MRCQHCLDKVECSVPAFVILACQPAIILWLLASAQFLLVPKIWTRLGLIRSSFMPLPCHFFGYGEYSVSCQVI